MKWKVDFWTFHGKTVWVHETLLQEKRDIVYENNDERGTVDLILEELGEENSADAQRQSKRMRNYILNQEPSMNPHNIHVNPPSIMKNDTNSNVNIITTQGMAYNIPLEMQSETTNDYHGETAQVYHQIKNLVFIIKISLLI